MPRVGDDDALVRVHASSLNKADSDYMRGWPAVARLGAGLRRPRNRLLGLDVAGRVEKVGRNVSGLRPGDEVWADMTGFGFGAFAEYVSAPAADFAPMPAGVGFEAAATVPQAGVLALQGLGGRRRITSGERVLINGAGGSVGLFAVQIAKVLGAEVTAVDSTGKLDYLRSIGADHVVDYTAEDVTRSGRRYQRILDIAAYRSILEYRRLLAPGGRYAIVGGSMARFAQLLLLGPLLSAVGSTRFGIFPWRPNNRADLDLLGEWLEAGKIRAVIDRRYRLDEVPEAIRYLESGRHLGKIVITM